jgi:hypothetical protein
LVNPVLQQAGSGNIPLIVTERMDRSHAESQGFLVFPEFAQHIGGSDEVRVVVMDTLQPGNVSDRSNGRTADLSNPLRNLIRHGKQLIPVIVEQKVVIAEVRSTHMPVKIIGFQVQAEDISEESIKPADNVRDGFGINVRWRCEWGFLTGYPFLCD